MRSPLFLCTSLLILSLVTGTVRADSYAGTWSIQPSSQRGDVHLQMAYHREDSRGSQSWGESNDVPLASLGLSQNDLSAGRKSFNIVQDAGTFHADGTFNGGMGGGSWTFEPSRSFAQALRARGVGEPSDEQQFHLGMAGFKLTTLDTLLRDGFERPSIDDLERMATHGVNDDFVNSMRALRISPKTIGELVRMRDHGVQLRYAAAMLRIDGRLNAEDLIRMRDHGVSETYVGDLARLGYHPSAEELVRLVDHGVSAGFIERMRSHGYTHLSVDDLIRLRDHGF